MEINPDTAFNNFINNDSKENIIPALPTERRPKITIQDTFLKPYFAGFSQFDSKNINKNFTTNNKILKDEDNFKTSQIKDVNNVSILSDIKENDYKKLSGRKTYRDKKVLDPLDIMTMRGNKGEFVREQRKKVPHIYMDANNFNENNTTDKLYPQNSDNIVKQAEYFDTKETSNQSEEKFYEQEFVPLAIRKKQIKK